MKRILHIVGARPNFMKIAPIMREMAAHPNHFEQHLVHTGQHYDKFMSQVFFDELELPEPDVNLEVGSGSHAWQTAQIMQRFESVLLEYMPDWVMVPGDVNSTVACALVAAKLGINVAHVEAGLRSFDRSMPEELNRIVTDHLSDLLFTTEPSGNENLLREGIPQEKIHYVGNTMIDTLMRLLPKSEAHWLRLQKQLDLDRNYILVTLHRPSSVDMPETLTEIMAALSEISQGVKVVFPVHPRTHQRISDLGLQELPCTLQLIPPLGYLDFLALQMHAHLVLTDSGGIQEETTLLGIPCLTMRPNTERPVTLDVGTNRLVAPNKAILLAEVDRALKRNRRFSSPPEKWDGSASLRLVEVFLE